MSAQCARHSWKKRHMIYQWHLAQITHVFHKTSGAIILFTRLFKSIQLNLLPRVFKDTNTKTALKSCGAFLKVKSHWLPSFSTLCRYILCCWTPPGQPRYKWIKFDKKETLPNERGVGGLSVKRPVSISALKDCPTLPYKAPHAQESTPSEWWRWWWLW